MLPPSSARSGFSSTPPARASSGPWGALYGAALGRVLYPAWEHLRGRPTFSLLAQLRQSERASADELEALRVGALQRLVAHAQSQSAYYAQAFSGVAASDLTSLADLQKLPLLDRATARDHVEGRTAAYPAVAHRKTTSGSTGQPLEIRYEPESRHWRDAIRWRGYGWAGYEPGKKAVHFWGVPSLVPQGLGKLKQEVDRQLRRDIYLSCMVRSPEVLREVVETVRRERPDVVVAYGQALADLARFINREGLRDWDDLPVLYGAERLWPDDRAEVERAFGPGVFETYGCREFMLMGSECEAHDGLHESAENLIVEILVRETDGSVRAALPGERGEVAVTDLHNLACPFIRYLNGDVATARAPSRCACGRTLPRFGPVEGRVTDTMRDADGNPVEGILFNILVQDLHTHARQFQVVQHVDRSLTLRLVPARPGALASEAEAHIRAFVARHFRDVPLAIELVEDIPLTKAGKLRRVIVEQPSGPPS